MLAGLLPLGLPASQPQADALVPSADVVLAANASSHKGMLWWDRHTHKTGGTTVREIMQNALANGDCMYWGYWQTAEGWSKVMDLLLEPHNQNAKLCIEAHYPLDGITVHQRHQMLMQLKAVTRQHSMNIVETTRVREPLDFYLSYFKWTIVGHQLRGDEGYNSSFMEWNPPNLQSNLLLYPTRSDVIENGKWQAGGDHGVAPEMDLASFGQIDFGMLNEMLDEFDLVGTTEKFDEFAVLAHQLTGVEPHYKHEVPDQRYLPDGHTEVTDAEICPDMPACREHVKRIAPLDYTLYEKYAEKFKLVLDRRSERVRTEGESSFVEDVAKLKARANETEEHWYGGEPPPTRCAWSENHADAGITSAATSLAATGVGVLAACQPATHAVMLEVKKDMWGDEAAAAKELGPTEGSSRLAAQIDLRVEVSKDLRSRKWVPKLQNPSSALDTALVDKHASLPYPSYHLQGKRPKSVPPTAVWSRALWQWHPDAEAHANMHKWEKRHLELSGRQAHGI